MGHILLMEYVKLNVKAPNYKYVYIQKIERQKDCIVLDVRAADVKQNIAFV